MWFEIVANKDGSVSSCKEVSTSLRSGRSVHYVEADSKAEAIKFYLKEFEKRSEKERARKHAQREKRLEQGLCTVCGFKSDAGSRCQGCLKLARQSRERCKNKPTSPPRKLTKAADKIRSQINMRQRDRDKANKKSLFRNAYFLNLSNVYTRAIEAYDSLNPSEFRAWLVDQQSEAERKSYRFPQADAAE